MYENVPQANWRKLISRFIKSEMSKRNIKYEDLSQVLSSHGIKQSASNLRNKINRGIMGADLFVQILFALNISQLDRSTIIEILNNIND